MKTDSKEPATIDEEWKTHCQCISKTWINWLADSFYALAEAHKNGTTLRPPIPIPRSYYEYLSRFSAQFYQNKNKTQTLKLSYEIREIPERQKSQFPLMPNRKYYHLT